MTEIAEKPTSTRAAKTARASKAAKPSTNGKVPAKAAKKALSGASRAAKSPGASGSQEPAARRSPTVAALPPFQAVVDLYAADVHRFLIFLVGPQEADDCFQETFLAALRSYPKLRADSNLRAWLLTVARSKAMDRFRRQKRGPELHDPGDFNDIGGFDVVEPKLDQDVWRHVRELPEKQRLAVAYRYAGDLSYEEIAGILDCSEDAARQSVSTGLKRLREVMKNA